MKMKRNERRAEADVLPLLYDVAGPHANPAFFGFDARLAGKPLLMADLSGAEGTILDAVPLRFDSLHLCEAAIHK
jgi:hypothetical protein